MVDEVYDSVSPTKNEIFGLNLPSWMIELAAPHLGLLGKVEFVGWMIVMDKCDIYRGACEEEPEFFFHYTL